ncbi:Por secretion system C-terminal sorting domain-containing protein [Chryseobacterium sp. RU37D]|uniref:T9SS-dependent choice-of-anchor J family protein n=1 Tax=Chryseobacterium sp. RU37D TaxID=1907397 RepID=UPI000953F778|nr:choice-of-anchor J domain-containing protein [Chryseobacterium sp. RU37D]SIQ33537.1 Por secretion system C-terminal sorting domain-containing protein [Chryseobacterium sp. RU37D]
MRKILLMSSFLSLAFLNAQTTNVYNYGFDSAFTAVSWTTTNQSSPSTSSLWSKANYTTPLSGPLFGSGNTSTVPVGQAGGNNSFGVVNFTSTSGAGIISNWLITSDINVKDGDIVSFYSRKGTDGTTDYPDRLELRYSTATTTVVPSGGSSGVGSFTNVGVTINPNLSAGFVYPKTWTQYNFTISGVGSTPVPVKFAFRYFVTDGGPSGNNSDLIGIDTFSVDRPTNTLATNDVALNNKLISVYPNPATDFINIKSKADILSANIYDATGRKVSTHSKTSAIDVRDLQNGSYILEIETKQGKISDKFIKK